MKDINKIKLKIYIYKYKYLIYVVAFVFALLLFSKLSPYICVPSDATSIGVIGTLLGAIVGGIFTLIGSVYVNNKQLTANFEIKRKNVIYRPLFDELLEINKIITEENPFPLYVLFEKRQQTITRHPQFDAWNRIKSDSRILETPKYLKTQYNLLIDTVKTYVSIRNSVDEPIKKMLNKELMDKFNTCCSISNIGSVISSEILQNYTGKPLLKPYISDFINNKKDISEYQIIEFEKNLYRKCNELEEIKNVRIAYDNWINEQNKTLELLENLIIEVGLKYEKQRS